LLIELSSQHMKQSIGGGKNSFKSRLWEKLQRETCLILEIS